MAREQGTKSSWNFLSWFYPSGPGRGFRGICGFGSAGRRTRYKKVIKCGETVCISTHLSGSRSLFFSFSANTPGEAAVEIWFTVLWNYGTCPNTRWLKLEFASRRAAGVDALDGGKILHLREPSLMCTIWYALSPRWRSKHRTAWFWFMRPGGRTSVSWTALLWSTVRSRWPGRTHVLGIGCWLWSWPAEWTWYWDHFVISLA